MSPSGGCSLFNRRLTMRKIQEMFRLRYQHELSVRKVDRSLSLSNSTVVVMLHRLEASKWT